MRNEPPAPAPRRVAHDRVTPVRDGVRHHQARRAALQVGQGARRVETQQAYVSVLLTVLVLCT